MHILFLMYTQDIIIINYFIPTDDNYCIIFLFTSFSFLLHHRSRLTALSLLRHQHHHHRHHHRLHHHSRPRPLLRHHTHPHHRNHLNHLWLQPLLLIFIESPHRSLLLPLLHNLLPHPHLILHYLLYLLNPKSIKIHQYKLFNNNKKAHTYRLGNISKTFSL